MIQRVLKLFRRNLRARKLNIPFHRGSTFKIPEKLRIGNQMHDFSLPSDNGSKVAFSDILLEDCYRIEGLPDAIQTVLDIGAHAGVFSIAARVRWPGARIHAYEPNPGVRPFITQHARSARFDFFGEAVGPKSGSVSIECNEDSVQTRVHADGCGTIPCIALEESLRRLGGKVDLVKMDCEGAEWELLQEERPWHAVQHVTMEYHLWAGYTIQELRQRIERLGFRIQHCENAGEDFGLLTAER